jgi:hypothetical protein
MHCLLAQMALGVVLLRWSYVSTIAAERGGNLGPAPAFTLLMSINAPVALGRVFWFHFYTPYLWDVVVTIVLIGALWYWVALNIDSWQERRMILQFKWAPLRIGTDLLAIALGAMLGLLCAPISYLPVPWLIAAWASALMWAFGPMLFYGRDLVCCIRRKSPKIGN